MTTLLFCLLVLFPLVNPIASTTKDDIPKGTVILEHIDSEILKDTKTGLNPRRSVSIYLPPGYNDTDQSYPVIYYFHGLFWDNERMFEDGVVQATFDKAIAEGIIEPVIVVAPNYSTPTVGSFFENSSTSGRWIDFTMEELLPFIESRFRTLANKDSRGITGELMGGYGAFKLAMLYPEVFGSVYALHPVATGSGLVPALNRVDWQKVHTASSYADLEGDTFAQIFTAMAQAYLPNPNRPPFYADFMVEIENGEPTANPDNRKRQMDLFLLDRMIETHAENLRSLNAIKFDWGRYDTNQDHVYANQAFTRKLDGLGIEHEAEEYRGGAYDKNWIENGRVASEMLPFFGRHLRKASE